MFVKTPHLSLKMWAFDIFGTNLRNCKLFMNLMIGAFIENLRY